MDIDKPLDEIISDKRQASRAPRSERGGGGGGRGRGIKQQRDRGGPTPYARPPPRSTEDKWVHDAYNGPSRGRGSLGGGEARFAGTAAVFTGASPRIQVVGLHYEVTPDDLKTIFSQAGTLVQGPTIRYDRSGRSTGEATMEFASAQQAKLAINKFDGAMTKGQTISIHLLPPVTLRQGAAHGGRGGAASQSGGDLLSRIAGGKAPAARAGPRERAPDGPRGGRGRGNAGRGRGGGGGARQKRGPATGEDLDKQLDSFMSGGNATVGAGDVDMST